MNIAIGAVLFMFVIGLTAVIFVIWVVAMLIQGLWKLCVGGPPQRQPQSRGVLDSVMCSQNRCHAINPAPAQFCRRCGSAMQGQNANVGRRIAS
jgi:hypothetical protein